MAYAADEHDPGTRFVALDALVPGWTSQATGRASTAGCAAPVSPTEARTGSTGRRPSARWSALSIDQDFKTWTHHPLVVAEDVAEEDVGLARLQQSGGKEGLYEQAVLGC